LLTGNICSGIRDSPWSCLHRGLTQVQDFCCLIR
jgi:hypothetical protein